MAKFHYRESPTPAQKKSFAPYLSEDEELVLVTGLSKAHLRNKFLIYFFFPGIIFGLLGGGLGWILALPKTWAITLGVFAMVVSAAAKTFHLYHANRYLLTTRRVMIKKGIFGVKLSATLYDKITHLEVDQSFIDRILLHHGSIVINTAGMNKGEIVLKAVDYPMELKNLLERLINREREQFSTGARTITAVDGEILN